MHQAEVYRVTLVCTHRGTLYKWSRQKCTGLHWYAHTEGCCTDGAGRSVQVTLVRTHKGVLYKWSRRKCTGLVHGHGMRRTEKERTRRTVKSRASPRDCFLFFRLDKVRVPYESGSTSCEKCPLTCKDGLCGKILMLCQLSTCKPCGKMVMLRVLSTGKPLAVHSGYDGNIAPCYLPTGWSKMTILSRAVCYQSNESVSWYFPTIWEICTVLFAHKIINMSYAIYQQDNISVQCYVATKLLICPKLSTKKTNLSHVICQQANKSVPCYLPTSQ